MGIPGAVRAGIRPRRVLGAGVHPARVRHARHGHLSRHRSAQPQEPRAHAARGGGGVEQWRRDLRARAHREPAVHAARAARAGGRRARAGERAGGHRPADPADRDAGLALGPVEGVPAAHACVRVAQAHHLRRRRKGGSAAPPSAGPGAAGAGGPGPGRDPGRSRGAGGIRRAACRIRGHAPGDPGRHRDPRAADGLAR